MILTLDVGNSHIFGGLFHQNELKMRFRKSSKVEMTSDELGVYLRAILREWGYDPLAVQRVAISSVVPDHHHAILNCCLKYFGGEPFFLKAGVKTGLKIQVSNPAEVGADRIAAAVGAASLYPGQNLIVVDYGTATTVDVIREGRDYLGGLIMPGLRTSMEALVDGTAKLPPVEIVVPEALVGRSTQSCIQSGLYYSNLFAVREMMKEIQRKEFSQGPVVRVGTGGFSRLFERAGLFDVIDPDLVLTGIHHTLLLNAQPEPRAARIPAGRKQPGDKNWSVAPARKNLDVEGI